MIGTQRWTPFRGWVHNLWTENCEEHLMMKQPRLSESEYFRRFRWWLRREYRHHLAQEAQREQRRALEPR